MENNEKKKESFYEMLDKQSEAFERQLEIQREKGEPVPESVWADGVPSKIEEKDIIKPDELMSMAINYIVKNEILPNGFKIEPGFPRPNFPNIVAKRNGKVYAIIVVPNVFPQFQVISDQSRFTVVDQCNEKGLIPLFAPVGYRSLDRERAANSIVLRGDIFITIFRGFIILNKEENQLRNIKPTDILNLKEE